MGCAKCGKMMKKGGVKKMNLGGSNDVNISKPSKPKQTLEGGTNQRYGIYGMATTNTANAGVATMKKGGAKKYADGGFPDLTGDGKLTQADVLKGRGVFKKGGAVAKAKFGASVKVQRSPKAGKVRSAGDQGYAAVGKREPGRIIKKVIAKKK